MWNFLKSLITYNERLKDLQAREERYRLITSVMSDYVFVMYFDAQGKIREGWIDGAFEQITSYTHEEFLSGNLWNIMLHPDDVERDLEDNRLLAENKKVFTELRIIRKDGTMRWVGGYVYPIWDEQHNRLAGVYGATRDITEQKQAELLSMQSTNEMILLYKISLALSSGHDLYHELRAFVHELKKMMIVDAFHIGFYDEEKDLFTYSLFLNDNEDLNLPPRSLKKTPGLTWEVLSKKQTLYLHDIQDPQIQKEHQIVIVRDANIRAYVGIPLVSQEKAIGVMSVQAKKVDAYNPEQIRLLETIAAQVLITSEKSRLLEQLQQELVERKNLLHEMEIKNAELERFNYTVSHDLRTPLVTIRGFLGFMEKSVLSGNKEAFQHDMARVVKATDRMNQLLKDLLELSRIGRVLNEKKEVSFENLVYAAIENVQGRLGEKNIKPSVQTDLPTVFVDQPRMIEVLQNLIDNAAKYIDKQKEPQIEIGFDGEQNGEYIFFVRDNGIGIAPEHHEKIFGLFNKLDIETEGTGVGLALVKRIVEFHGGRIWVKSASSPKGEAGSGATFYFTLPVEPSS